MRKLKIGIVLLVVIGFPLVSWIYLRSGLNWRITAQEETAVKGAIGGFSLSDDSGVSLTEQNMMGRFYIMTNSTDTAAADQLNAIHEQFAVRDDYRTICIVDSFSDTWHPTEGRWMNVMCEVGCADLLKMLFMEGDNTAIVDDSLQIRGRYDVTDPDEVRALIRHTAVVLPIEKREKLELKRRGN